MRIVRFTYALKEGNCVCMRSDLEGSIFGGYERV